MDSKYNKDSNCMKLWRVIIESSINSVLTIERFCEEKGLTLRLYYYWLIKVMINLEEESRLYYFKFSQHLGNVLEIYQFMIERMHYEHKGNDMSCLFQKLKEILKKMEKRRSDGEENKKMAKYCTTGIVTSYRIGEGIIEINSDLKHNGKNIWIEVDCNDDYKEKCSAIMLCQNQNIFVKGGNYCCFQSALQTAAIVDARLKFYIKDNQSGGNQEYTLCDLEIISK